MSEIKDAAAQVVIASPPFTNNPDGKTLDKDEYLNFMRRVFCEILRVLMPSGVVVCVNTDLRDHARYNRGDTRHEGLVWQKHSAIRCVAESVGLQCFDTKIWAKSLNCDVYRYTFAYVQFFGKSGKAKGLSRSIPRAFRPDVWLLERGTYRRDSRGCVFRDAIHPEIVKRCLDRFTSVGDLVVSPFAGSGTILSVARMTGRRCVGYETNKWLKPLIEESIKSPERFPAYLKLLSAVPGS